MDRSSILPLSIGITGCAMLVSLHRYLRQSSHLTSKIRMTYVPCENIEEAKKLANGLVQKRLAACVNIIPEVISVYEWEGKIENGSEAVMLIKSSVERADDINSFIKENHSYDEPAVVSLVVDESTSSTDFMDWVKKQVS